MPLADRDLWTTGVPPYGSSSDYTISAGSYSNSNVPLTTTIGNIAFGTLVSILASYLGLSAYSSAGISHVATIIKDSFTPKTHGLSFKNFKKGNYIESIKTYVIKNNVRWFPELNFKGTSKIIPTYSCKKYY